MLLLNDAISRALRELKEKVAEEQDLRALQQLILGVNGLLDVIEERVAQLDPPTERVQA